MPRIFFAAIAVLAGVVFDLQPVKASEAPWCAVISKGDVHLWDRADINSHAPFGTRPASSLFGLSTR